MKAAHVPKGKNHGINPWFLIVCVHAPSIQIIRNRIQIPETSRPADRFGGDGFVNEMTVA